MHNEIVYHVSLLLTKYQIVKTKYQKENKKNFTH